MGLKNIGLPLVTGQPCRGSVEVVVKFVDKEIELIDADCTTGELQETVILYVS